MFEAGKRYRVWYQLDGKGKVKMFVGTYLGESYDINYDFDLRPLAGTSSVRKSDVQAFRPTEADHALPKIVFDIPSIAEDESTGYQYSV